MNRRYERKFIVSELTGSELESIIKLHPALFSEIYYERKVNNIYFDTIHFSNYWDNEIGSSKRLKVRIRWYGDLFQTIEKPTLEIKAKDGLLGHKISYSLNPLNVSNELCLETVHQLFMDSFNIPDVTIKNLLDLDFTLLNSYKRKYFQSADKKFRITIDSDLLFYKIYKSNNFFINKYEDRINTILELKYDEDNDKYAESISNFFPFRISKSSKYVSGLYHLY